MMNHPQNGDVVLRPVGEGRFDLVDAITEQYLACSVQLSRAVQLAQGLGATALWQQNLDDRGRPLGDPFRLPLAMR